MSLSAAAQPPGSFEGHDEGDNVDGRRIDDSRSCVNTRLRSSCCRCSCSPRWSTQRASRSCIDDDHLNSVSSSDSLFITKQCNDSRFSAQCTFIPSNTFELSAAMERLSIHDQPPPGASPQSHGSQPILPGPPGPPAVPQLPPQMFTTAASLLDLTDSKTTSCLN